MNQLVAIKISANIYWGYTYIIERNLITLISKEEIIQLVKYDMEDFFKKHNLLQLKDGVTNLNLHFHEDIKDTNVDTDTIYLCDHKHTD